MTDSAPPRVAPPRAEWAAAAPVPSATPSTVRVLAGLALLVAAATVVVDLANLAAHVGGQVVDDVQGGTFGLAVRTVWALLRAVGLFVFAVQARRRWAGARPLGVILAVTTLLSVGRLAGWGEWTAVRAALAIGFGVVVAGCVAMLALLATRSVAGWLVRRPARRPAPLWVVTAGVFVASYLPLMLVPALVAAGEVFGDPPVPRWLAVSLLVGWLALIACVYVVLPPVVVFLRRGHRWARAVALALSVVVLVSQPPLCAALLGVEGLVRDGVPIAVSAVLAIWGLAGHRAGREFFRRRPATG